MQLIVPPIKSQGIKTKLVPWIQSLVPTINGRWIEPFFGTGVVGFNVKSANAILSDINPHIIHFYQAIQDGVITSPLVREYLVREGAKLQEADNDGYAYFLEVRDRFNRNHDQLDFLFLSRTGFNGMMRFNRKGEWNIPFCKKPQRFSQSYITKIVNQVRNIEHVMKPNWRFAVEPFDKIISLATADDLIYCDPPYIGRYVDYYCGWTEKDEEKLFSLLSSTPARFILSTWHHNNYRANPYIEKMWSKFHIITHEHFYHSGGKLNNRNAIVEALVSNFEAQS